MLSIRRETDYAVRTVLHLATLGGEVTVQVRDVAASRALPLSFVRRIVARLSAAGILATTRGMGGGIQLARPASQITLLDVCRAMGDDVTLNRCLEALHSCPFAADCPAQAAWAEASDVLAAHLSSVTFEKLAGRSGRHRTAHRKLGALPGEAPPAPVSALPARPSLRGKGRTLARGVPEGGR